MSDSDKDPTSDENPSGLSDLGRNMMGSTMADSSSSSSGSMGTGGKGWQPPTAEDLAEMLAGYEIIKMLGRGGMGAVYMGRQVSLDRIVAIKILSSELDETDAGFADRFQNEARAMAKLNHPGIVAVHDFGETETGLLFIVMEYVDGTDVARMIAADGRLHTDYAMAITAHVCDAVNYAHELGIIHRDIKPANIMVGYDGVVKVADFGLAKACGGEGESVGLTQSGMVMGTMHYMAPEMMILGSREVDNRADIYAVGVMLYHMLTGKVPHGMFQLPSMQVQGLDPRYDGIIARAMQEDREERFQNAMELRADLDAILTQPVAKVKAPEEDGVGEGQAPAALPTQARPQRPGGGRTMVTGVASRTASHQAPRGRQSSSAGWIWGAVVAVVLLIAGAWWWEGKKESDSSIENILSIESSPDKEESISPEKPVQRVDSEQMAEEPEKVAGASVAPTDPKPAEETRIPDSTPPVTRNSKTPASTDDEWIDLITHTDPQRDVSTWDWIRADRNVWTKEGGELVFPRGYGPGEIRLPHTENVTDFQLKIGLTRESGSSGFDLKIPTEDGATSIAFISGQDDNRIMLGRPKEEGGGIEIGDFSITNQQRQDLLLTFRASGPDRGIVVERDGETLATWNGDYRTDLVSIPEWTAKRLGLWVYGNAKSALQWRFHELKIRSFGAPIQIEPRPDPVTSESPPRQSETTVLSLTEISNQNRWKAEASFWKSLRWIPADPPLCRLDFLTDPENSGNQIIQLSEISKDETQSFYSAPLEELKKRDLYGQSLKFQIKWTGGGRLKPMSMVVLRSGSNQLEYTYPFLPTSEWQSYTVSLEEGEFWWREGELVSEERMRQVLSSLDGFLIRAEFSAGPLEKTWLKNVELVGESGAASLAKKGNDPGRSILGTWWQRSEIFGDSAYQVTIASNGTCRLEAGTIQHGGTWISAAEGWEVQWENGVVCRFPVDGFADGGQSILGYLERKGLAPAPVQLARNKNHSAPSRSLPKIPPRGNSTFPLQPPEFPPRRPATGCRLVILPKSSEQPAPLQPWMKELEEENASDYVQFGYPQLMPELILLRADGSLGGFLTDDGDASGRFRASLKSKDFRWTRVTATGGNWFGLTENGQLRTLSGGGVSAEIDNRYGDIASNAGRTIALRDDGTIDAWGGAFRGEEGMLSYERLKSETNGAGLSSHSFLRRDGSVLHWDYNVGKNEFEWWEEPSGSSIAIAEGGPFGIAPTGRIYLSKPKQQIWISSSGERWGKVWASYGGIGGVVGRSENGESQCWLPPNYLPSSLHGEACHDVVDVAFSRDYILVLLPADSVSRSGYWKVEELIEDRMQR